MEQRDRKEMIKETFNTVAPAYDHAALRFFPESARHLAACLALQGDEQVLDVACGTGNAALALSAHLPRGQVTAIDFSAGMLARAHEKTEAQGLRNIRFVEMDMQSLTFAPGQFDAAVSAFGIFFVEDMTAQLRHIAGKVRPGGRIAVSGFYEDAFMPLVELFLRRMEAYGIERPPLSWKRISSDEKISALLASAGLENIEVRCLDHGYYLRDAGDWWQVVWNAGFRGLLNLLTPIDRARFQEEHLAEIQPLCGSEGLWLDVKVLYAVGVKPAA